MTSNLTDDAADDSSSGMSLPVLIVIAVLIAIMIILTMGGNLCVLITFAKDKTVRKFSDCLILNLAISDLIIGSICIPLYAPLLLTGDWPFGHGVCLLWLVFDYVTPAASTLNICCISFDRYLQVGHPLWARTHRTNKLLVALLITPWVLPALFFLPAITLWEVGQGPIIPDKACFLPYNVSVMMLLGGTLIEFIFPFITVATFNVLVYTTIRQRSKRFMTAVTAPATVGTQQENEEAPEPKKGGFTTNNSKSLQQDRKAARSLFILVLTFGICWMPFEVTALVSTICGGCVDPVVFEVTFWLLWINSTINPVLYPLLHPRYRRAFLNLLTRKNRVVPLPAGTSAVNTTA
ncbi:histamine H3 receptor-like [Ylistrum balloti]|uniref:histamine H3 receptor-like n=1 Tax=Ylistrum balloti TaxID=509963 RepID=UPI0029058108|nr:histamine H3 receptor-like [Ylistrum balloti]